jgi:hypothetical protein
MKIELIYKTEGTRFIKGQSINIDINSIDLSNVSSLESLLSILDGNYSNFAINIDFQDIIIEVNDDARKYSDHTELVDYYTLDDQQKNIIDKFISSL